MKFSKVKSSLKLLFGWSMPVMTTLSSVWSPLAQGATTALSPDTQFTPEPSPVTFVNPLNENSVNIFAGHSSHRSHSSHQSHSSHRSHYSGGGGYAPSTPESAPSAPQSPSLAPATPQTPSKSQKPSADQLTMMVMRVQLELRIKELYDGPVDGIFGEETKSALRIFQIQKGIAATGRMDTETLTTLGISVP